MIRSLATGRVLDVDSNQISDGTEVALWEEKEKSLVEGLYFICIRFGVAQHLTSFIHSHTGPHSGQSGTSLPINWEEPFSLITRFNSYSSLMKLGHSAQKIQVMLLT